MWTIDEITVEIEDVDETVMIIVVTTPIGEVRICGSVTVVGRVLYVDGTHVDGLAPGALGRAGLDAIGRKLLAEADVEEIVIKGGARTTGRNRGKVPREIRFRR